MPVRDRHTQTNSAENNGPSGLRSGKHTNKKRCKRTTSHSIGGDAVIRWPASGEQNILLTQMRVDNKATAKSDSSAYATVDDNENRTRMDRGNYMP